MLLTCLKISHQGNFKQNLKMNWLRNEQQPPKRFRSNKGCRRRYWKRTVRTENTFDICNWVLVPLFRSLRPLFWSICAPFVLFGAHLFIRRSCRRCWDCKHLSRIENGSCLDSENAILDLEKSLLHAGSWTQDILVCNSKLPSQPDMKV